MPLSQIYDYFRNYDQAGFTVFAQQGDEPIEADIAGMESQVGFVFPDEFREFAIHPLGGLYMAVREELWPRPKPFHVGPAWSFLYGLMVYSFSPKAPDWLQMRLAWQKRINAGQPELVPFLRIIGSADLYCFTQGQKIVIWRHETPDKTEDVSATFSEVLMGEIRALEDRKARKIRGEDK